MSSPDSPDAERESRAQLYAVMSSATLQPEQVFDRTGIAVPLVFVALAKAPQDQIDDALSRLRSRDEVGADLDEMMLNLAVGAAQADIGAGRSDIYLLPLDFALFAKHERRDHFAQICQGLPEAVRQRVMFMPRSPPVRASHDWLIEVTDFLQPLGAGVGLLLDDADSLPDDLPLYGIELVALSAEAILTAPRGSPSLARLLSELRLNKARLIARQVHDEEDRVVVARIGADLASFAPDSEAQEAKPEAPRDEEAIKLAAYAAAIKSAPVACVITDLTKADNPITSCNPVFTDITGYAPGEAIGRNWRFLQGRDTNRQVLAELRDAAATGASIRRAVLLYRKDGMPFWGDLVLSPVRDEAGALSGMVALLTDITTLRAAEASRQNFSDLVGNLTDAIPGWVFQRTVTKEGHPEYGYVSPSFHRAMGVAADHPLADRPDEWVHPDDRAMFQRMMRRSGKDFEPLLSECRLVDDDGEIHWIRSMARPVRGSNGAVVWNGVAVDITPEKATEERLSYLADHDHLTGFLNRGAFRAQLSEHIATARAEGGAFGVLSIDISHFQPADDSSGSVMDDSILQIIAERITKFDWVKLAARGGGAEFTVVLTDMDGPGGALAHAHALRREIAKPIEIATNRIAAHTSMGLALYPNHVAQLESGPNQIAGALTKAAGVALFTAKRAGPGYCHVYSPEDVDRIRDRAVLWQTLFEAYENRQFVLNYQPIVDLKSGRISGARALVRWSHPKLRVLRADQFIPLAEKMGLVAPLGAWVLEETLRNLRQWGDGGGARPWITIDIDAAQLQHPEACAEMSTLISASDANSAQIEIELNPSDLIDPTPTLLANLAALRAFGVTVAIDGFAAGNSLFRNPRSLPIDKIRLDSIMVGQMTAGSGEEVIVRGMIAIGRDLGLTVIAEGVETQEQRDILLREGCHIGQGDFYSAPVTAEEFGWLLREQIRLPMSGLPAPPDIRIATAAI